MENLRSLAKLCRVCLHESDGSDDSDDNRITFLSPPQIDKLVYIGDSTEIVRFNDDDRLGLCIKCELKLNWVYDYVVKFNSAKAKFREYVRYYPGEIYQVSNVHTATMDQDDSENEAAFMDIIKVENTSLLPCNSPYRAESPPPNENCPTIEPVYSTYQIQNVPAEPTEKIVPKPVKKQLKKKLFTTKCTTHPMIVPPDAMSTVPTIRVKPEFRLIPDDNNSTSVGDNACHICQKSFSTRANMLRHEREHLGRRFVCSYENCDSYFTQKSSLQVHLARHEGHKPYGCDYCGKKFSQSKSLVFHIRIHTGESPYECDYCQKTFKQKSNLIRHFKSHSKMRPMRPKRFQCFRCQKWMASKQSLDRHMNRHDRMDSGMDDMGESKVGIKLLNVNDQPIQE